MAKQTEAEVVLFYAKNANECVMIPVLDENGNQKMRKGKRGEEFPHYRRIRFTQLEKKIINGNEYRLSSYATADPYEIDFLMKKAKEDEDVDVVTMEQFEKDLNPQAAERQKQIDLLAVENDALKNETQQQGQTIAKLQSDLAKLQERLKAKG